MFINFLLTFHLIVQKMSSLNFSLNFHFSSYEKIFLKFSSVVSGPYQDKESCHQPMNSPSPNDSIQPTTDPLAINYPVEPIV